MNDRERLGTSAPEANESPDRVLAGPGSGSPCAYCHQPIVGEVEYEVLAPNVPTGAAGQSPPRVHVRCYEPWRAQQGA